MSDDANRKTKNKTASPNFEDEGLDRRWHLATTPREVAVTELEYSLFRSFEAFCKWQVEGMAVASGKNLSASDGAILNVIAMRDRPKGITEIGRLLNRDDMTNIQYTIRKLTQEGLIEKTTKDKRRKGVSYRATEKGLQVIQRYVSLRKRLLIKLTETIRGMNELLENGSHILDLMTGIYEQAARVAAAHRNPVDDDQ
ncbi:winged helix DNA-binding protein [Luteithermobacter gelatinilyticus]|uniref:winged helix DNA-binding protein n=1 Tax=Luteithermobacter gelatinilyticus TaxID=2582913 RepID=UPI001106B6AE|nr:winged helix DNA-binding protein [Luteithermobacter gelatinilyticus]